MASLVLGSSSPYRRDLLQRLGIDFEILAPRLDERLAAGETAAQAAARLAAAKAAAVAGRRPAAVVLASDQLADLEGRPLGKPADEADAGRQLGALSGRTVTYCTAVAVRTPGDPSPRTHLDLSRVTLRRLSAAEIDRYLERERPLDCAGALRLEGLGIALCERIETADPTALIGLPLAATAALLRDCGFEIP